MGLNDGLSPGVLRHWITVTQTSEQPAYLAAARASLSQLS